MRSFTSINFASPIAMRSLTSFNFASKCYAVIHRAFISASPVAMWPFTAIHCC